MRSYGPGVPSIAFFFTLVSENNWLYNPRLLSQRQRAAFVSPGLLERSENAVGGGRDRKRILRRRYSGEPGPEAPLSALFV